MTTARSLFTGLIMHPVRTLISLRDESLASALLYYLAITLGFTILSIIMVLAAGALAAPLPVSGVDPLSMALFGIELICITFVSLLIGTGIVHGAVWLMDGAGTIQDTIRIFCYAETPSLVVGWVPVIGWIIASVWSVILLVLGLKEYHRLTLQQAVIAVLLPLGAVFLIMIAGTMYLTISPEV
jgi:hypothetical protein